MIVKKSACKKKSPIRCGIGDLFILLQMRIFIIGSWTYESNDDTH